MFRPQSAAKKRNSRNAKISDTFFRKKVIHLNEDERIQGALKEIRNQSSVAKAARRWGLNQANLRRWSILGRKSKGGTKRLTEEEEQQIHKKIDEAQGIGHPFKKKEVRDLVDSIVVKKGFPEVSTGWWSRWWNSQADLFIRTVRKHEDERSDLSESRRIHSQSPRICTHQ